MDNQKARSPGRLTARRFFRNRLAVIGLGLLAFMFLFSFVGGGLSPYGQAQVFYREELQEKEIATLRENTEYRFFFPEDAPLDTILQAQFARHIGKEEHFTFRGISYSITALGKDIYALWNGQTQLAIASKYLLSPNLGDPFVRDALTAFAANVPEFVSEEKVYAIRGQDVYFGESFVCHISPLLVGGTDLGREFLLLAQKTIEESHTQFSYQNRHFSIRYEPAAKLYSIREEISTRVWDSYAAPSRTHPLGTDKNGMDVLTRLQYGGRVSLVIGFLVVLLSGFLGMVFGGISGYFGGFLDNLIMRIVDIFYCIPTTPLLIILGAALDGMRVDPKIRMVFLMLTLGFFGWPSIARLVRGQILSLREQEFITATEACGIRVSRRIFHHLLPNVIPQLIVTCTMQLGSTILTEATLSFLGLGVKFPFASWGNIMNDVANVHVLTSYLFVWLPAGVCLVLSVLGFNFVGDGLRDAFDPRMKR